MTKFDMKIYKELGSLLRDARIKKDISLDTLSSLLDGKKTKSTLKRYEDGISRIDMETLEHICRVLNVNKNELIEKAYMNANVTNTSPWGDDKANTDYLMGNPELLELYNEIRNREDMYILFDKVRDLDPKDVESILAVVQTIRKAKGFEE